MVVTSQGKEIITLITIRNEARMSMIKSQISAGFSQSTWLKQEHQIDETLDFFVQRLHEQSSQSNELESPNDNTNNNIIALDKWISFWTFDTLAQLAFSDSRGFLAHGRDVDGVFAGSAARFRHWKHWILLPSLEQWLFKSWLAQRLFVSLGGNPGSALVQLAMARIEERKRELGGEIQGGIIGQQRKTQEGDVVAEGSASRDLVGRFLAASAENPQAIEGREVLALTISTIHAGADTTSSATANTLANALAQPETWRMLEEEILTAGLTCPPAFKEVAKLPVLDAVIRESLWVLSLCAQTYKVFFHLRD